MSIIEVLIASVLFCIAVAGVAKVLTSSLGQYHLDIKQELANLAVNNGTMRLYAYITDHCGNASFSGGSEGACDASGKTLSPDLVSMSSVAFVPPDLSTACPGCQLEVLYTCDNTNHIWNGYVRVVDTQNGSEVIASASRAFLQDACN